MRIRSRPSPCSWAHRERQDRFRVAANRSSFSSVFEAPLGLKSISFEAENALSAATATGQWAQPDCYVLDVAAALFFPLFLLGRSRNLRERGGGRADLRLLLFWLFGFPVAPNLTFRHRNSLLRRLAGCEHNPILAYLPTISPNASAGIGRPPRRRTAVPGRTALSRIAIGCPFESNLTA